MNNGNAKLLNDDEDVNAKFLNDLITQILTAAESGVALDVSDPDAVGQFVCAIIGLGAGLIPVVGSSLAALSNLLGAVIFGANAIEQIWDALRARIEQLIDQKIEEYHLKILKGKILGFQSNMSLYKQYLKDFDDAETPEEKKDAADTLKASHIAFLSVVMAAMPEFQVEAYAVPSICLFSLAATIHLTLLADGIKRGKGWGYSEKNVETLRAQFKAKTTRPSVSGPNDGKSPQDILLPGSMLEEAISRGIEAGVPSEILDTWKEAHAALYLPSDGAPRNGDENLDYPTYAKKICVQGRTMVKIDDGDNKYGYRDARNYQAFSNYDSSMVLNVLNYAELWPFMAGDAWTANAIRNVDREIFYGPYGRYNDHVSWGLADGNPPPVTDRPTDITAINLRAWDDVDGLMVKHGSSWDGFQGNSAGGAPREIDLAADESIISVMVNWGFKLGALGFKTNKNREMANGNARHAGTVVNVAPPGYELTSVIITRWVRDTPTGCEGVILGFRPLLTDPTKSS